VQGLPEPRDVLRAPTGGGDRQCEVGNLRGLQWTLPWPRPLIVDEREAERKPRVASYIEAYTREPQGHTRVADDTRCRGVGGGDGILCPAPLFLRDGGQNPCKWVRFEVLIDIMHTIHKEAPARMAVLPERGPQKGRYCRQGQSSPSWARGKQGDARVSFVQQRVRSGARGRRIRPHDGRTRPGGGGVFCLQGRGLGPAIPVRDAEAA
jgi:hypothetical protein